MVAVAVRADDWFFIYLLTALFLPFPDDSRGRNIVSFVTFLAQYIGFFVAGALLPSTNDFYRRDIVARMTLSAGRVNLTRRIHFIRRGGVVFIVFMSEGFAVAVGAGVICLRVPLGELLFCIIGMADVARSVFSFRLGGSMFGLVRLFQKQRGIGINDKRRRCVRSAGHTILSATALERDGNCRRQYINHNQSSLHHIAQNKIEYWF